MQLVKLDRIYAFTNSAHRIAHGVCWQISFDIIQSRLFAIPIVGELIDDSHLVHLGGGINLAILHHLLGQLRADSASKEAVGSHTGEAIEQDLRESEASAAFGNDEIAAQCGFEAAAQSIALDDSDRDHVAIESGENIKDHLDAIIRVSAQRFMITDAKALDHEG